jgi:hypothetical protein
VLFGVLSNTKEKKPCNTLRYRYGFPRVNKGGHYIMALGEAAATKVFHVCRVKKEKKKKKATKVPWLKKKPRFFGVAFKHCKYCI